MNNRRKGVVCQHESTEGSDLCTFNAQAPAAEHGETITHTNAQLPPLALFMLQLESNRGVEHNSPVLHGMSVLFLGGLDLCWF